MKGLPTTEVTIPSPAHLPQVGPFQRRQVGEVSRKRKRRDDSLALVVQPVRKTFAPRVFLTLSS